jgi:hypothetical protein
VQQFLECHLARVDEVPVTHALGVEPMPVWCLDHETAGRQVAANALEHRARVERLDVHPGVAVGCLTIALHRDRPVRAHHVLGTEAEAFEHGRRRGPRAAGGEGHLVTAVAGTRDGTFDGRVDRLIFVEDRAVDIERHEPRLERIR